MERPYVETVYKWVPDTSEDNLIDRGAVILLAESRKGLKKSWKTGKTKKVLQKTGKNICARFWKMSFLSHGNPGKYGINRKTQFKIYRN